MNVAEQKTILDKHLKRRLYNHNPNSAAFAELVLRDDQTGQRIDLEPLHTEWHQFINKCISRGIRRIGIMSPFEHGKTTFCLGLVLHFLTEDPTLRTTIVCNSDDNATKRVSTVASYIDNDEEFSALFGDRVRRDRQRKWTDHQLYIERESRAVDPSVEARGLTTRGAGSRIDRLILDDICDIEDTKSETKRKNGITQLRGLWLHRITENGIALCIATAYHQEDAVHWLLHNPEWGFLIQRINADYDGLEQIEYIKEEGQTLKGTIPDLFSQLPVKTLPLVSWYQKPRLLSKRMELGERDFERGFRQNAFSDSDRLFKHFYLCQKDGLGKEGINPEWPRYTGVDLSSASRPGNVITTIAVDGQRKKYIEDLRRGNWSSPETARQIIDVIKNYNPVVVLVENNAYQDSLRQWMLENNISFPIAGYNTGKQKLDPTIGLPGLDVEFENGAWVFDRRKVEGHLPDCECAWCRFLVEIINYPQVKPDDMVMSLWLAREAERLYGYLQVQDTIQEYTTSDMFGSYSDSWSELL